MLNKDVNPIIKIIIKKSVTKSPESTIPELFNGVGLNNQITHRILLNQVQIKL